MQNGEETPGVKVLRSSYEYLLIYFGFSRPADEKTLSTQTPRSATQILISLSISAPRTTVISPHSPG